MRKRVLLVEDHPDTSDLIQRELNFVGYDVLIAEDGLQAVSFSSHLLPDVIVMDLNLPKLNGIEATIRIRKNPKTAAIPILAATAMTGSAIRQKCLDAGCNDYLAKPFTYRELDAALKNLLEKAENAPAPAETAPGGEPERS
ncbi:MAG TPA: response regulator [Candidatus Binatia bacterium]